MRATTEQQPYIFLESSKREILKLIAIVTMLADHIGIVVFENEPVFRIIGRISFPLFAMLLAEGFIRTKHPRQYATRLFVFFLISQIPFMAALQYTGYLNIFLDLLVGFLLLWLLKTDRTILFGLLLFTVAIFPSVSGYSLNYGWYWLLVIVLAYLYFTKRLKAIPTYALFVVITCLLVVTKNANFIQLFTVLSPLVAYAVLQSNLAMKRMPKYLYYAFYPAHLILLWFFFR